MGLAGLEVSMRSMLDVYEMIFHGEMPKADRHDDNS